MALEGKAANLVGFAGIVLALLFTSDAAADSWNALLSIGAGLLAASVAPLAIALLPRRSRFNPNLTALRRLRGEGAEGLEVGTAQSIERAIRRNSSIAQAKARAILVGIIMIVCGVAMVAGALIYLSETR